MKVKDIENKKVSWVEKAPMETPSSHCAVAVYKEKIYVFGGGGLAFESLCSVAIYDPKIDHWETGRDMPTPRSGAVALNIKDKIYVIGGGHKQTDSTFRFLKTVEIYHPETNTWETGHEMLMPHDYPAAAFLNNHIYIMGGHHPDTAKGGPKTDPGFNFCERLNLKEQLWEEIDPLPTPRFALSAVVIEGKILAMGGVALTSKGFNNFDLIEVFDLSNSKWRRGKEFSLPWPAAGFGSCILDGLLFVFGGYSGDSIHSRAAYYEPGNRIWKELTLMPIPLAAMGVGVVDKAIYLIGGWTEDGKTPVNRVSCLITKAND